MLSDVHITVICVKIIKLPTLSTIVPVLPAGTIVLQQKLDRETKPSHTFIIVAKDTGVPQQSSSATVYVTVTDENDNIPDFVAYPTVFRVSEDASIGQEVYVMTANDNDEGDFGTVVYSLEGVDSGDGSFQIDPRTVSVHALRCSCDMH